MIKFGGEDGLAAEDFLSQNNEELSKSVIDGIASDLEAEHNNEAVAVNEDDFDYDLGVSDEELEYRFNEAIRLAKEKSRIMGKTTCEYDDDKDKPYLLYPDGHKEYPTLD